MCGAVKLLHTDDGQEIAANAADVGPHAVQHVAKLLDIGFTGSIIDGRRAFSKYSSHNDIGRTRDRRFVKQHISTTQLLGTYFIDIAVFYVAEAGTEVLEAQEMSIQTATTNLVTTGGSDNSLAHAPKQRTYHQYAAAQGRTLADEIVTFEVFQVEGVSLESIGTLPLSCSTLLTHLHTDVLQQQYQVIDVADVGDIAYDDLLTGQQRGTDNLKCLVLCTLRRNGAAEQMSAFYLE